MGIFDKLARLFSRGPTVRLVSPLDPPAAARARQELQAGGYDKASAWMQGASGWSDRWHRVAGLCAPGCAQGAEAWTDAAPESADAWLLRGALTVVTAADVHMGHAEEDISEESAVEMEFVGIRACKELERAAKLDPRDPVPHALMITAAVALTGTPADADKCIDAVRARDPHNLQGHLAYLLYSSKKWYGSHEKMFDFARRTASSTPVGGDLYVLLARAHIERWQYAVRQERAADPDAYWRDPAVRQEIEAAHQRGVGAAGYRPGPDTVEVRNQFAHALVRSGAQAPAAQEIDALQGAVTRETWECEGDPVQVFEGYRQKLAG